MLKEKCNGKPWKQGVLLQACTYWAECTFEMLESRFRLFQRPFEITITTVFDIVKAVWVLHNYLRNAIVISDTEWNRLTENLSRNQLRNIPGTRSRSVPVTILVKEFSLLIKLEMCHGKKVFPRGTTSYILTLVNCKIELA